MSNTARSEECLTEHDSVTPIERQSEVPGKGFDKELDPNRFSEPTRDAFPSPALWFSEVARATPQSVAVSSARQQLSYGELEERANQLAHRLRSQGVSRGTVVGLFLTRSVSLAVGALGILKAGGAYLPLDPGVPTERLAYLLQDAEAPVLITETQLLNKIGSGNYQVIDLDVEIDTLGKFPRSTPENSASPEDLAYIIYTSGSTGTPKGVEITHRSLMNLVQWHQEAFGITRSDRASHLAGLGFDAAVWELWPYLTAGASVHFVPDSLRNAPEELRDWLATNKITIGFAPTPLAEFLLDLEWPANTSLRMMLTGGDTLHSHPSKRLPFELVNNYGPTECTVVTTSGLVPAAENADGLPRIGRPIRNMRIHILDENLQPVPGGEAGELFIGGAGLARGYRNRPDLTEERFISDPFSTESGARLYRTGDLVRLCADGQLAFLGRIDEQIKIDGYRIEPEEVVHRLEKHPAVQSSVVLAREVCPGNKKLIAYIVAKPGSQLNKVTLRSFLEKWLPSYMIPSVFVRVEKLPLTPNGKVDRDALPPPAAHNIVGKAAVSEPRTAIEERLSGILSKLMGLDKLGLEDNFFTLGGHSLLGTQLIGRIRDAFGVEISLRSVFDAPTISELSAQIEQLLLARLESMSEEEANRLLSAPGAARSAESAL
jgi:amino acid adenylation domain-containing protein